MSFKALVSMLAAVIVLASCDAPSELRSDPEPIGDFRLGFVTVSAKGSNQLEMSREFEESELEETLVGAIEERLGRHAGNRWYHLAVSIEEYSLAPPGIPVVASPRSGMVIRVAVWDDASGRVLTEPPKEFVLAEPFSIQTFMGSGISRSSREQARAVSRHAARVIEDWLKSAEKSPLPSVRPREGAT